MSMWKVPEIQRICWNFFIFLYYNYVHVLGIFKRFKLAVLYINWIKIWSVTSNHENIVSIKLHMRKTFNHLEKGRSRKGWIRRDLNNPIYIFSNYTTSLLLYPKAMVKVFARNAYMLNLNFFLFCIVYY